MLPLLLMRPDLRASLIEPRRKRIAFLNTAIGSLSLVDRARVVEERIDPDAPHTDAAVDMAVSRATFAPDVWLRIGLRLAPRVAVLCAGEDLELPDGAELVHRHDYRLPAHGSRRTLLVFVAA
jgi:16S rRNA (guanine527-N7)-methyltransferase